MRDAEQRILLQTMPANPASEVWIAMALARSRRISCSG